MENKVQFSRENKSFWAFPIAFAFAFLVDLVTKVYAERSLPFLYNESNENVEIRIFTCVFVILTSFVFKFLYKSPFIFIALGLVLGGAMGNVWGILLFSRVVDFIRIGDYVYNMADMFIYASKWFFIVGAVEQAIDLILVVFFNKKARLANYKFLD
jgi:hypothetical protein